MSNINVPIEKLADKYGQQLDEIAEAHDHLGTLQGWTLTHDGHIELVFDHGIVLVYAIKYPDGSVVLEASKLSSRIRTIYRIDEI